MFSRFLIAALFLVLFSSSTADAGGKPVKPTKNDKCPVCGMFVYKYPNWISEIVFKDGSYAVFDGPKDMFKYYMNIRKHHPSKTLKDIHSVYVTEYYNVSFIDGLKAYYVIGSDTLGPMGRELVPFATRQDAGSFSKDHKGTIISAGDINESLLKSLD